MSGLKRFGYLSLFLVIGMLMPVSIVVAGGVALRQKSKQGRLIGVEAGVCSLDADCPEGFMCFNGKCVPAGS